MTRKTIFAVLAVFAIGFMMIPAYAASPGSPLEQYQNGTPIEKIQCKNDKILMQSLGGSPVCLNANTVEVMLQRGYITIEFIADELTKNNQIVITSTAGEQQPNQELISTLLGYEKQINCTVSTFDVELPRVAQVGVPFNVTATFEFEANEDVNAENFAELCRDSLGVIHTPNYQASHPFLVNSTDFVDEYYLPAVVYKRNYVDGLTFDQKPITLQLQVNQPEEGQYDFGYFHLFQNKADVKIYTSISGDTVQLSQEEFVRGESDPNAPIVRPENYYDYDKATFHPFDESKVSYDVPYKMIADSLKKGRWPGTAEELIRGLGLDDEYLENFFKEYPEFKTQSFNPVLNWILPQAFGQSSTPNLSIVTGKITVQDPDGNVVPVYGVKVIALDVDTNRIVPPVEIRNGMTLVSDVTDAQGNYVLMVPLMDLQGGSSTPDLVIKASFDTENFLIQEYGLTPGGYLNRNLVSTHTLTSTDPQENIHGPIFNNPTFQLPSTQFSSKASYIINTLQPTHDWYETNVSYNPTKAVINWTPGTCLGTGVDPSTNILFLQELTSYLSYKLQDCRFTKISALENPDTLRHEYAHMTHIQKYSERGTTVHYDSLNNVINGHSPVHATGPITAFTEGWAFFMAKAYDNDPTYQPAYMLGQWNFETRGNTETTDPIFAGKSYPTGQQEGNIAAALFDIVDSTNEQHDNFNLPVRDVWNALFDDDRPIVRTMTDFENNWNAQNKPSINNILNLNTIVTSTTTLPPQIMPTGPSITSLTDDFQGTTTLSYWILSGDSNWESGMPDEDVPGENNRTNKAAISSNCDDQCILTLGSPIDTSNRIITISFDRFVDSRIDSDEGLYVQVSTDNGATWITHQRYTDENNQDTDSWVETSVSLSSYSADDLWFRFVAESSSSNEHVEIDNFEITSRSRGGGGGGGTNPPPVADNTSPTITAPGDITTEATDVLTPVTIGTATATDNRDPNPTITNNAPGFFPLGDTIITYTATDEAGNTATDTQTVTIQDTTPPVITQIADITILDTDVVDFEVIATDIFEVTKSCTHNPGDSFPLGTTTVTCTATDTSSNAASITFDVIVTLSVDTIPPMLLVPNDMAFEATGQLTPLTLSQIGTATATDNRDPNPTITNNAPGFFPLGDTFISYTATDETGNATIDTQIITVHDITVPTLFTPVDITIEATDILTPLSPVQLGLALATDTVDPNPAITNNAPDSFPLGHTVVKWTATDETGNSVISNQNVNIVDTIPPAFPNVDDITTFTHGSTATVNFDTPTATDIFSVVIMCNPQPDFEFSLGTHIVTCTATDESNNTAATSFKVIVAENTRPEFGDRVPSRGHTVTFYFTPGGTYSFNISDYVVDPEGDELFWNANCGDAGRFEDYIKDNIINGTLTVNIPEDATLPESCRVNAYTENSDGTRSYTPYTFKILFETPLSDTLSLTSGSSDNIPRTERTGLLRIGDPILTTDDVQTLTVTTATLQAHEWRWQVSNSAPRVAQYQENILAGNNTEHGVGVPFNPQFTHYDEEPIQFLGGAAYIYTINSDVTCEPCTISFGLYRVIHGVNLDDLTVWHYADSTWSPIESTIQKDVALPKEANRVIGHVISADTTDIISSFAVGLKPAE